MKLRTIKYKFLLLAGLFGILLQSYLFMYGCSAPANSVDPSGASAKSLYSAKCSSCHRLLPPQDYTAEQWRHYVDKYGKKMTQLEKEIVLDYLEPRAADAQDGQQELSH